MSMSILIPAATMMVAAQATPLPPVPTAPLIIDQGRADRAPPGAIQPVPEQRARGAADLVTVDAVGDTTPIRGIAFDGAEVPATVAAAARTFIGEPANAQTLQRLARAMSDAYEEADVALYTVVIPAQDFSTGTVRVQVAEGFVEAITYPNGASPLIRAYAERMKAQAPLSRRALQRYLSLMRDIPGAAVDARLLRGARPGGVVLALTPKRERSDFSFGFDNRNTQGLGNGQFRAEARGYSLLRDGDRTQLTLLAADDFKRYRYAAFSHMTPLGSDGMTATASLGYLETRPQNSVLTGEARTAGLSIVYPVIRGYKRNLTVSLGLDGINSDAAAFGAVISSDRTRALRLAAGYSQVGEKSVATLGGTVSRGVDMLGARGTPGFTDTTFTKLNMRATLDRQVGKRVIGRLRASGQYSRDRLAAVERFAVGGVEFGRAFDAALLSGDRGWAGLAEIALRPKLPKFLENSEIYAFIDHAEVRFNRRIGFAGARFDLASAGGGVRLVHGDRASLEVEAARHIDSPYPGFRQGWRVNIGWRLTLGRS
jgi:hemolysin activation/secretion protein